MNRINRLLPPTMLAAALLAAACNFPGIDGGGGAAPTVAQVQATLADKNFGQAAALADQLTAADPKNADAWIAAAEAKAAVGSRLGALAALETALANGMRDGARIDASPYLAPLRSSSEYQPLLQRFSVTRQAAAAGDTAIEQTAAGIEARAGDVSVKISN